MFMRRFSTAAFSTASPSPALPESEKSSIEVIGESDSSLKDTSASTLSQGLNLAKAGGPSWAMLLMMMQAIWACFSLTAKPWEMMAKRRSRKRKESRQQSLMCSDLSVRQAKISRMDQRISWEEQTSRRAKYSILFEMSCSQAYSCSYISARSRSIPVQMSSQVYFSRNCSIVENSYWQSRPFLLRLLKMSVTFLASSRSFCCSSKRKSTSTRSDSRTACMFLWFMRRFLRAAVRARTHSRAKRSLGGQFLVRQEWMDSRTKGYWEKRKGASVLTLKSRRVLMEQMISSRRLLWKPMIRCFTSAITGYSLVRFRYVTLEVWSTFSQYFLSSVESEECVAQPSILCPKRGCSPDKLEQHSPLMIGFLCLPATNSGKSAESSLPKKKRCSQPSRYF